MAPGLCHKLSGLSPLGGRLLPSLCFPVLAHVPVLVHIGLHQIGHLHGVDFATLAVADLESEVWLPTSSRPDAPRQGPSPPIQASKPRQNPCLAPQSRAQGSVWRVVPPAHLSATSQGC